MAEASHLLVRAGQRVCALPVGAVRRIVRALTVHPLPGAAPELLGLAEFAGEPLAVVSLARLIQAPPGANPVYPVTVVVRVGGDDNGELLGLAADAALDVVELADGAIVGGDGALIRGEAPHGEEIVRVLDLAALAPAPAARRAGGADGIGGMGGAGGVAGGGAMR
jgi:chemotaxis signal transduction protein